jgi:thermostable 8-oxoguanine DNA glycosylase
LNSDADFSTHVQVVSGLLNRTIATASCWDDLSLYTLITSSGKIKDRFTTKYPTILSKVTDDMFGPLKESTHSLCSREITFLNDTLAELKLESTFMQLKEHFQNSRTGDSNLRVEDMRDMFKLLQKLLVSIEESATRLNQHLKESEVDKKVVQDEAMILQWRIILLEGLVFNDTYAFILENVLGRALEFITTAVDESRQLERAILNKGKAKKKAEALSVAAEAAEKRFAAKKAKIAAQLEKLSPERRAELMKKMQEEEAARVENEVESEVESEPLDENDDIDNETNTPTDKGSSAASKVLAWLKLLTSNVHHPMTFRGLEDTFMVKEISFDVLTYPKSSRDIVKWEELVKETVLEDHYEEVFQKLQELDYRLVKGSTVKFSGRVHCEAMMATAVLLAKKRYLHKVRDLLLHEQRKPRADSLLL